SCLLTPISSSASACSVTIVPQTGGSPSLTGTYSASATHSGSAGGGVLTVLACTGSGAVIYSPDVPGSEDGPTTGHLIENASTDVYRPCPSCVTLVGRSQCTVQ